MLTPSKKLLLIFAILFFTVISAKADFGEVDLLTRESVENHFNEYNQDVRLETLQIDRYYSDESGTDATTETILHVETRVKAYNEELSSFTWYACSTKIHISITHHLRDFGTECTLEIE